MPAPTPRPRSRALLSSLPQTFSSPVRLALRQTRTLSLRGPAVLLSKPTSFTPETDSKLLLLSPTTPPTAHSTRHASINGLRVTFRDSQTRDAFLAAAQAAIRAMSAGIARYAVRCKVRGGVSSDLYLVQRRSDGVRFLMKMVAKEAMGCQSRLEGLVSERAVLAEALGRRVPFITRLVDAFETESHLCVVMERPEYGDLRSIMQRAKRGRLTERVSRKVFAGMVLGVEECHAMGYLNRGVKLGGVGIDRRGHVKLMEFGLAKRMEVEYVGCGGAEAVDGEDRFRLVGRTNSLVGTRRYMAPEQIGGKGYGAEADVWALGVALYVMLVGRFPFGDARRGGGEESLYDAICLGELRVPKGVRKEARVLLEGMLEKDVTKRWDLGRVKRSAWMRGIDWRDLRFAAEHGEVQKEVLKDLRDNGVEEERFEEGEVEMEVEGKRISVGSAGSSVSSGSLRGSEGRSGGLELVGFGHINYPQRV